MDSPHLSMLDRCTLPHLCCQRFRNVDKRASEIAQQVKACTARPEDLRSIPGVHMVREQSQKVVL